MGYLSFLNLNLFISRDTVGIMIKEIMSYYTTRQLLLNGVSIKDNDTNTYANEIHTTVTSIAKECIPNRCIKVKPSEPL